MGSIVLRSGLRLLACIFLFFVGAGGVKGGTQEDLRYLKELTSDVVEASRVRPGQSVKGAGTNTTGFTLIMPGGTGGYPAFWIRDFSMSLESGFITPEETLAALRLTARSQNGSQERRLKKGLILPPFAIPDHINFDSGPVFYPGTYSAGEDQGDGTFGILPPIDDHFEFMHMAWHLFNSTRSTTFLHEEVAGITLIARLDAAFQTVETDPATGLVTTTGPRRAVGFGFCDTVYLTGDLLFPSLLRHRAAGELAEMSGAIGRRAQAREYRNIQRQIEKNLGRVFRDPRESGWLLAATEVGQQADVWGTLYALHLGVLERRARRQALRAVADGVRNGTITCEGAVRHVPSNLDARPDSAWERTAGVARNTYQNGAYWHTPTGWLIEALEKVEPELARRELDAYLAHLRTHDFRLGAGRQAPWECFAPGGYQQNGVYMTSVTLPYAVLGKTGPRPR